MERCSHKPRNVGSHQKQEEAGANCPRGSEALLIPRFSPGNTDFILLPPKLRKKKNLSIVLIHQVPGTLLYSKQNMQGLWFRDNVLQYA